MNDEYTDIFSLQTGNQYLVVSRRPCLSIYLKYLLNNLSPSISISFLFAKFSFQFSGIFYQYLMASLIIYAKITAQLPLQSSTNAAPPFPYFSTALFLLPFHCYQSQRQKVLFYHWHISFVFSSWQVLDIGLH